MNSPGGGGCGRRCALPLDGAGALNILVNSPGPAGSGGGAVGRAGADGGGGVAAAGGGGALNIRVNSPGCDGGDGAFPAGGVAGAAGVPGAAGAGDWNIRVNSPGAVSAEGGGVGGGGGAPPIEGDWNIRVNSPGCAGGGGTVLAGGFPGSMTFVSTKPWGGGGGVSSGRPLAGRTAPGGGSIATVGSPSAAGGWNIFVNSPGAAPVGPGSGNVFMPNFVTFHFPVRWSGSPSSPMRSANRPTVGSVTTHGRPEISPSANMCARFSAGSDCSARRVDSSAESIR